MRSATVVKAVSGEESHGLTGFPMEMLEVERDLPSLIWLFHLLFPQIMRCCAV